MICLKRKRKVLPTKTVRRGVDIIKEIVDILPQVLIYVVSGYVFIKAFTFVSLKENQSNIEHILISSFVTGYIYCNIISLIPVSFPDQINSVLIIFSALVSGYLCAIILRSRSFIKILSHLKIRDTGNKYYWDDLMDNTYPMKAKITYDYRVYEGMIIFYESFSNDPHVILTSYIIKDKNNNVISDFTNDKTKVIVLDTPRAASVEIIYHKHSEMCSVPEKLCAINTSQEIY